MRWTGIAGFGLAAALAMTALPAAQSPAAKTPPDSAAGKLMLASTDISAGGQIAEAQVFNGFGCTGGNVSPALSWSNPPAGTRSFALLMHDPDAPTGSGWWHWVVYNIPASVSSLPVRRPVSAARQAASLLPAPVRAEGGQARRARGCDRRLYRVHGAHAVAGEGRAHGCVWPLAVRASGGRRYGRGC